MGEAVIVAGIGCRSGVSVDEIDAALQAALAEAVLAQATLTQTAPGQVAREISPLARIATAAAKGSEPAIAAAARRHGIPLVLIAQPDLESANARTLTRSEHSLKALNVNSVAEAAALAGAGADSRLLGPRIKMGAVTCALATSPDELIQAAAPPQQAAVNERHAPTAPSAQAAAHGEHQHLATATLLPAADRGEPPDTPAKPDPQSEGLPPQ